MATPTRFIEQNEFNELAALEEGDSIPLYKLTAIPFQPPLPDGLEPHPKLDGDTVRLMLLPVTEPRLYRDPNKVVFVVYPSFDTIDYADAQDMHPVKGAWAYRVTPYDWDASDASDPLDVAQYYTDPTPIPAFELGDTSTH